MTTFLPGQMVRVSKFQGIRDPRIGVYNDQVEGVFMVVKVLHSDSMCTVKAVGSVAEFDYVVEVERMVHTATPEDIQGAKDDLVEAVARLLGVAAELENLTMKLGPETSRMHDGLFNQVDSARQALSVINSNTSYLKAEGAIK